jgi:choline monooxygenase
MSRDPHTPPAPPGAPSTDPARFARLRESLFPRTWHVVATLDGPPAPGTALPLTLLPGLLDEPLLLTRPDEGGPRLLSNVCTHRAALLCEAAGAPQGGQLRCRYHGRRFALDGRCLAAPGFEGEGVPSSADDLPAAPHGRWGPLLFAALQPAHPLRELLDPLDALLSWLPLDRARTDPSRSGDYLVPAHWALYLENFLEGFHVPFVHPSLARVLDWQDYETRLWPRGTLQVGFAKSDAPDDAVLLLPPGHPDHGRRIAGYYAWLWPCTMVNVYPWGLSVNLVQPLAANRTRVRFLSCVWDERKLDAGAGAGLQQVEREDEDVVGLVQRGMGARLWRGGGLSARHEKGVAHFRAMLDGVGA